MMHHVFGVLLYDYEMYNVISLYINLKQLLKVISEDYYNLSFALRRKIEDCWMKQEENESLGNFFLSFFLYLIFIYLFIYVLFFCKRDTWV